MTAWLAVFAAALAVSGLAWFLLAGLNIKAGWQNGRSPLAKWLDSRRRRRFDMQLPEALATISNSLRAGFSTSQAFDSVVEMGESPISDEFQILQQQMRIGMSMEDALESMTKRVGSDDFELVATAISISRKTGGNITEIFDRISETIRGRMRIERKILSLTAQGRMQGIIVSAMPFILGAIMTALKPNLMIPFFCSLPGAISIAAVVLLIAIGWFFILKIIKIDV